jgi:hypothetical protein
MTDLAIRVGVALRLLDEAVDHRESKPGPDRPALGGEERLEHLAQVLRWDAASGIGDREQDVLAGRHIAELAAIRLVEKRVRDLDVDSATFRHRVARVDDEIDDRIFKLACILERWPESASLNVSSEIVSPTVRINMSERPRPVDSSRLAAGSRRVGGSASRR